MNYRAPFATRNARPRAGLSDLVVNSIQVTLVFHVEPYRQRAPDVSRGTVPILSRSGPGPEAGMGSGHGS
jgi:hypothetical protein